MGTKPTIVGAVFRCVLMLWVVSACSPARDAAPALAQHPTESSVPQADLANPPPAVLREERVAEERIAEERITEESVEEHEPEPVISTELAAILMGQIHSRSLRGPNDGSVENSVAMPIDGPGFRFNPRRPQDARFGTGRMVRALVRAAMQVHEAVGGEVTFNDLGLEHGGPIAHHGSHRTGRDVDVLFYLFDENEEPHESVGAFLDREGFGVDFQDLRNREDDVRLHIDLDRTWRFVESLIAMSSEEGIPLQRIFLVEHVRSMLLDFARTHGGNENAIARFAMLTCQPSAPHDDHFHFRFFCHTDDMAGGRGACEDALPHYPWRQAEVAAAGEEMNRHYPRRNRPMAPIVTPDAAEAAAGPMAPEPRAWLRRRRAWRNKPHPGRRWCR